MSLWLERLNWSIVTRAHAPRQVVHMRKRQLEEWLNEAITAQDAEEDLVECEGCGEQWYAHRPPYRLRAFALHCSITARNECMADVCRTRGGALSPLSPNESRKRSRGSSGTASTFFKRHRTGQSFARRLLHLRGLAVDVRQAEELVKFIDQFPPEMDKVRWLT